MKQWEEDDEAIHTPSQEESPKPAIWPQPLDLEALDGIEPEPPQFIIPDWLPCGYATLLAGHGGVGKSGIALHIACCMALGRPFFGLEARQCRILYLSCEDRSSVLHWRLSRICAEMGIRISDLKDNFFPLDLVGYDAVLYQTPNRDRDFQTMGYWELAERMKSYDVVFIDGITDTYGGNENDKAEVKRYVNSLVRMVDAANGAVLLVGHVNKVTAGATEGTSEGYSGTTAWHNAVRARWYLYPEKEDQVKTGGLFLDLQKSNLGRSDQTLKFQWDDEKHLFLGQAVGADESLLDRRLREDMEREGIIQALRSCAARGISVPATPRGPRTAFHVLAANSDFPLTFEGKAGINRFWRLVESLTHGGRIIRGSHTNANRHKIDTLEATDAPVAPNMR